MFFSSSPPLTLHCQHHKGLFITFYIIVLFSNHTQHSNFQQMFHFCHSCNNNKLMLAINTSQCLLFFSNIWQTFLSPLQSHSLLTEAWARTSHYPSPFLLPNPLFPLQRQSETGNEINVVQRLKMNGFWLRPPLLVVYGARPLVFSITRMLCQRRVNTVTQCVHSSWQCIYSCFILQELRWR